MISQYIHKQYFLKNWEWKRLFYFFTFLAKKIFSSPTASQFTPIILTKTLEIISHFKFCSCDPSIRWMRPNTLLSVRRGVRFIRMPEHSPGQIRLYAGATVLHLAGGGDISCVFKHPRWMVRSNGTIPRNSTMLSIASFCFTCLLLPFTFRLSTNKQNKVYLPEEPFPHAFLVKNARLKHYTSTYAEGFSNDYRQPCVVFCGHPSLRFGDAVHFVQLWGNNPLHTIIFTGILLSCFLNCNVLGNNTLTINMHQIAETPI